MTEQELEFLAQMAGEAIVGITKLIQAGASKAAITERVRSIRADIATVNADVDAAAHNSTAGSTPR